MFQDGESLPDLKWTYKFLKGLFATRSGVMQLSNTVLQSTVSDVMMGSREIQLVTVCSMYVHERKLMRRIPLDLVKTLVSSVRGRIGESDGPCQFPGTN